MNDPNTCGICHERFRLPEFAERCEAQGVPPLVYMVGDVLLRTRGRAANKPPLLVVRSHRVHHGTGVVCPVDGPCEHEITYWSYLLYPDHFGSDPAWLASCAADKALTPHQCPPPRASRPSPASGCIGNLMCPTEDVTEKKTPPGYERVARLTELWGVVPQAGEPATYIAGPYAEEDWQRLWGMYPQRSGRWSRRKMTKALA